MVYGSFLAPGIQHFVELKCYECHWCRFLHRYHFHRIELNGQQFTEEWCWADHGIYDTEHIMESVTLPISRRYGMLFELMVFVWSYNSMQF
jgi:hypothetical protein